MRYTRSHPAIWQHAVYLTLSHDMGKPAASFTATGTTLWSKQQDVRVTRVYKLFVWSILYCLHNGHDSFRLRLSCNIAISHHAIDFSFYTKIADAYFKFNVTLATAKDRRLGCLFASGSGERSSSLALPSLSSNVFIGVQDVTYSSSRLLFETSRCFLHTSVGLCFTTHTKSSKQQCSNKNVVTHISVRSATFKLACKHKREKVECQLRRMRSLVCLSSLTISGCGI